jgi:hypothetical protein
MTFDLELRDREILRTLLRVRFLTTREINGAFFACPRVGRRRLHKLSERDYVKPHSKGLPARCPYSAWRLTTKGLDAVGRIFPDDPVPDGLLERLGEQSLYNLEHREAIARIYLSLIVGTEEAVKDETPHAATRKRIARIQGRAGQLVWRPDGDVELGYTVLGKNYEVIPDATVSSPGRKARVFIELDRSTKSLARIRENLKCYRAYLGGVYAQEFTDGLSPHVLYVVGSDARGKGILGLARDALVGERVQLRVLRPPDAIAWLDSALLGGPEPVPRQADAGSRYAELLELSKHTYRWAVMFLRTLNDRVHLTDLQKTERALLEQGDQRLLALYDHIANGRSS